MANFNCVAGAIDGIVIWITRPTVQDCEEVGCSSGKFFCAQKGKFGLNCQAGSDCCGQILDMSIVFPASSSDLLGFKGSSLYQRLQDPNFLAPNLCFFDNNVYLESPYMATPHPGSVSGVKDAYNFYHSRCCIRVECAFGMLTERWGILRSTMPRNITICKTIALVYLLARLHNFCIQQNDSVNVAQSLFSDELHIERLGGMPLESTQYTNGQRIPEQLIGGGHWFSDHN